MSEHAATTTYLVCFSGKEEEDNCKVGIRICLGSNPSHAGKHGHGHHPPFFFTISLTNLRVQLPNPLPGAQPVQGTISITETLPLSIDDLGDLHTWLQNYAPHPHHPHSSE